MANLFFIHTPLQVMVAQMIIKQDGLTDNVMLQGYVGNNSHFLDIYRLTMVEDMWKAIEPMHNVASWAKISRRHLWHDCKTARHNFNHILHVIVKHKIDTVYLGDMKNGSCQLAAFAMHNRGLKVCFFEEGAGHYVMNDGYGKSGNWKDKLYATIIDLVYYRPVYSVDFANIIFRKGLTIEDLPIDRRFSVVPFYHEPYDTLLTVSSPISPRLKDLIVRETSNLPSTNCRLLLTSPIYNNGVEEDTEPYVETIVNTVTAHREEPWLIKFHPREYPYVRQEIIEQLNSLGVNFIELGREYNVPVEYYLQSMKITEIVHFFCSTAFYNGYLFPKTHFECILPQYYQACKEHGLTYLNEIENLLNKLPQEK